MAYYPKPYAEILKLFPTEEKVFTLIFQAKTTYCGHCGGFSHIQQYRSNYRYVICRDCKKTTSILRETFLAKAHLDLRIWVYIIYATLYARHPTSYRWIMQELKINSYNTIWCAAHKIKAVSQRKDKYDDDVKILRAFKPFLAQV